MKLILFIIIVILVAAFIWYLNIPEDTDTINSNEILDSAPSKIIESIELQRINDCVDKCTEQFCQHESGKTICYDLAGLNECSDLCGWEE